MANILHISRTMGQGGAEKIVYQLATEFSREFDTIVIASTGGQKVEHLNNNLFHIKTLDIERKSIGVILKNLLLFIKIIRKHNISHIHVHHRMGLLYCQMLRVLFPKIRIIYTAHNIFSNNNALYNKIIKNTEIVAVGKGVQQHLIKDVHVKPEDIRIIYNGVKPTESSSNLAKEFIECKKKRLLCIARLSEQKGLTYLIQALSIIDSKEYELFIIGEGDLLESLENQVSELELDRQITFLGYRENVHSYIRECDFIILPSLWEGFPLTPIECFMNQKTIIATSIAGTNEIVNENNGILVPPKQVEELAKAIDFYLSNPSIVIEKSKIAYQEYQNKFSYGVFLEKYRNLYFKEKI